MEEELKDYGLKVYWSEADDREPIDFSISDGEDNVCWVWGSEPWKDVQIECDHPYGCVEYDDDETVGECALCGATCDWHYETNLGDDMLVKERIPHDWHMPDKIGGIVGRYLKRLQEKW